MLYIIPKSKNYFFMCLLFTDMAQSLYLYRFEAVNRGGKQRFTVYHFGPKPIFGSIAVYRPDVVPLPTINGEFFDMSALSFPSKLKQNSCNII